MKRATLRLSPPAMSKTKIEIKFSSLSAPTKIEETDSRIRRKNTAQPRRESNPRREFDRNDPDKSEFTIEWI